MKPHDVYLKITPKDGAPYVLECRVWDAARFIESTVNAHKKAGGGAVVISKEQYVKER